MKNIKIYLDIRTLHKDGTHPLKLVYSHIKRFYIPLGISVKANEWSNNTVIKRKDAGKLNMFINRRISESRDVLFELAMSGKLREIDDTELKEILLRGQIEETEYSKKKKKPLFIEGYKMYTARMTRQGTILTLQNTLSKIGQWTDIDMLTFEKMNTAWLKDFDAWMSRQGLSPNTRGIYLRNIRAIFNDAIDRDIIPFALYPYRRFKIPKTVTQSKALTITQLIKIRDCKLEPHMEKYRDMFMLMFYLIGINISDLVNIKSIDNGRIYYSRNKTGRLYSIEILDEAKEIIERYKGEKQLLDVMDRYENFRNYRKRLNENLKKIAREALGLMAPPLTTYYARHTWATIAYQLGISKDEIRQSLGHGTVTVTDTYINYTDDVIDRANRKVVKAIKKGGQ